MQSFFINVLRKTKLSLEKEFHLSRKMEVKLIFDWLDVQRGEIICDIGCGDGYWSRKLSKKGCKVFGIDCTAQKIGMAQKMHNSENCNFSVGFAEQLPYSNGFFDKVISICAMEHFKNDQKALKEMKRVLKDDGIVVLSVDSLSYRLISERFKRMHKTRFAVVNYYTIASLKRKMKEAGFEITEFKYVINSRISSGLIRFASRFKGGYVLTYPLYPLAIVSDTLFGFSDEGHKLLVKAKPL